MEIFTKPSYSVGVSCKVQPSAPDAQAKSERYLNRTKFVIAACCLEATMIEKADSGVTFEVRTFYSCLYIYLPDYQIKAWGEK